MLLWLHNFLCFSSSSSSVVPCARTIAFYFVLLLLGLPFLCTILLLIYIFILFFCHQWTKQCRVCIVIVVRGSQVSIITFGLTVVSILNWSSFTEFTKQFRVQLNRIEQKWFHWTLECDLTISTVQLSYR